MVRRPIEPRGGNEARLAALGLPLPGVPTPLGSYVEAVQAGDLLFLSGMLPVIDHKPAYVGRIGRELDSKSGREAARIAALNALSALKKELGSLDRITRVVRIGVFMTTVEDFVDHPGVADGASDLFRDVFGEQKMAVRSVIGVASLPLGVPIELEATFQITE